MFTASHRTRDDPHRTLDGPTVIASRSRSMSMSMSRCDRMHVTAVQCIRGELRGRGSGRRAGRAGEERGGGSVQRQ
eukprot:4213210-Prymnesium_polylepis.1